MAAKRRVTSQAAGRSGSRIARLFAVLLLAAAGMVLANNAGLLPENLRQQLVVRIDPLLRPPREPLLRAHTPPEAREATEAFPGERDSEQRSDDGPPVPRSKPPEGHTPRPWRPRLPRLGEDSGAERADRPESRQADKATDESPAERPTNRPSVRPAARDDELAQAVAGALTVDARRSRLADIQPPETFSREWSGGAAALSVAANEISHGPTKRRRVALTLDGHFEPELAGDMLEVLRAEGVKATFFLTGRFARRYPATVRRIAAAGHEIGNHSDSHPALTKLDDEAVLKELCTAEEAIVAAAGRAYRPYVRMPFGDRNVPVLRLLIQNGFLPVYWSCDTLDWKEGATAEGVLERIEAKGLEPGAVILAHLGSQATARALPRILAKFSDADLQVGTLSALLEP